MSDFLLAIVFAGLVCVICVFLNLQGRVEKIEKLLSKNKKWDDFN